MRKLLFFLSLVCLIFGCSQPAKAEKAPNFTLKNLQGQDVSLSNFQGKVVLIDFWATWCPPCRMEIPHLVELSKEHTEHGLVVLGISLDNTAEDLLTLTSFIQANQINYPVLLGNDTVCQAYGGISGIPTLFLIDSQGEIIKKYVGYTDKAVLEKDIQPLLEKIRK